MDTPPNRSLFEDGREALRRGEWPEARAILERVLLEDETPEALEALGRAAYWLDDCDVAADARERAYHGYRSLGDARGAARIALALADDALIFHGQEAVSNGWSERARSLLADLEPSVEHAVLATRDAFLAFMLNGDMDTARRRARDAAELALQFKEFDLEMHARAIDGVAQVAEGSITPGMRLLDEATAAATSGEMRDLELIASTCCWMIYGCARARDYPRAAQWCLRVQSYCEKNNLHSVFAVCRSHYGSVLTLTGAWARAETELEGAAGQLARRPAQAAEGAAHLAELRRRQGRHDEAFELLAAVSFLPEAQLCLAHLALDRKDPLKAVRLTRRLLRQVPESDRMQRLAAHELLTRAHSALHDVESAQAALDEVLRATAGDVTPPVHAAAALAGGVVALASRESHRARTLIEDSVDGYRRSNLPYEEAEARRYLAEALTALGETEMAHAEIESADQILTRLGAVRSPRTTRGSGPLTERETEILALVGNGLSDKEIAEHLTLSAHTVHRHISNIRIKLAAPSRAAAVAQGSRLGLI